MVTKKKATTKRKNTVKTPKVNNTDLVDAMIAGEIANKTVQVKDKKKKKKVNQNYFSRALEFLGF